MQKISARDHEVPADVHQPPLLRRLGLGSCGLGALAASAERAPTPSAIVPVPSGRREVADASAPASSPCDAAAAAGEDDRADRRDEQQERGDLERQQELRQQQLADLRRRAEAGVDGAPVGVDAPSAPSRASRCTARRTARRANTSGDRAQPGAAAPGARGSACRRRRRRRTRRAPSPRRRRRRPARRRRTPRAAAGTAPRARAGGTTSASTE